MSRSPFWVASWYRLRVGVDPEVPSVIMLHPAPLISLADYLLEGNVKFLQGSRMFSARDILIPIAQARDGVVKMRSVGANFY